MDFCPNCGSMILHGTKCKQCGADINGFYFEKLEIGTPKEYISNKWVLKENFDEFLELIVNKDEIEFTKDEIFKYYDKIIEIANNNFIQFKKDTIPKELNDYLKSNNQFINKEKKLKIKNKLNKSYFSFYDELNLEDEIEKFNKDFLDKIKQNILEDLPDKYISYSEMCQYQRDNNIDVDLDTIIEEHNDNFIEKQMEKEIEFFDNIDEKSLDKNQKIAVLTDDDNTQIVAGAGTGKTLTIQAKVKYLIEKQGVSPEDILCISFSNSARDDLANKIKRTVGDVPIDVRTFHSLGYSILGINGYDREVPKHELSYLIKNYFKTSIINDSDLIKEVVEFFSYYFNLIYINEIDLKLETLKSKMLALDEYDEYLSEYLNVNNVKRKKEYMNTVNELIVANYLFIHNIDYEYSKQLKFKDKNYDKYILKYSEYLFDEVSEVIPDYLKLDFINEFDDDFACEIFDEYPNFFLRDKDIYIDLIDNGKQNIDEIIDKRNKLNNSHKTKLLAIFVQDDIENFLNDIHDKLVKNDVIIDDVNYEILFERLISQDNSEFKRFVTTVETFINLFKGNARNIDYAGNDVSNEMFNIFLKENHEKYEKSLEKRNKFFLTIIERIYEIYKKNLEDNDYIDFNDMINDAVIELRNGAYIHEYKYVIVDEYQDTSHTRYNLLKEIQNATDSKVVVVGDDWQSIYGFTGCDVNLFSQFDKYFENPKMVKINITRRNSQKLIDIVGQFIQENKNQIQKELKSQYKSNEHPIKLFEYVSRAEEVLALINILEDISKEKNDADVLILGRNNRDIYEILCREIFTITPFKDYTAINYVNNSDLNIEFRTVHKSKGLEADYVVVLNLNNQINGFPNKIINDPILDFVNNIQNEGVEYPEERRLFYVALTRTKNDVYLFSRKTKPSSFVTEIKHKEGVKKLNYIFSNDDIIFINHLLEKRFEVIETEALCPKCNSGKVSLIVNNEKGTSYFRCSNFCGWEGASYHNSDYGDSIRKISYIKYVKTCPKKDGILMVRENSNDGSIFLGCTSYPDCRVTESLNINLEEQNDSLIDIFDFKEHYEINRTRFGVYYMDEYIPEDKRENHNKKSVDFSKRLIGYKRDKDNYSVNLFTNDLIEFIINIANNEIEENVTKLALVAVPSSKVDKINNSMKKSIDIIEEQYMKGELESDFNSEFEIINCKNLLKRVKDVPTAHLGEGRANCEEHIDSIECMENNLSNENIIYLILDDITTTGSSMRACNEVLLDNGVNKENILNIAIGATVRDDDGEI